MTTPSRDQVVQWALEAGFTVRNGVVKVVHSNGSLVAINDLLAEFAAIAFAEGQVAQVKRHPPSPMVIGNHDVEALAAAVRTEREACAEVCDNFEHLNWDYMTGAGMCANLIRKRGRNENIS